MSERLQKVLAARGLASRRRAEDLIAAGRVTVNGHVARLGEAVDENAAIAVDGAPIPPAHGHVYLALNKPAGVVTTARSTHGERNVLELLPPEPPVRPAGRLDKETSGLLLLSNDGEWSNLVTHPRYRIEKEYEVLVRGRPTPDTLERMRGGVEIAAGVVTAPARVETRAESPATTRLSVTVMEGKKRQIRLMSAAVGHPVLALRRVRIGTIRLGDLPEGRWRLLRPEEVESIRDQARQSARGGAPPSPQDRYRRAGGRR